MAAVGKLNVQITAGTRGLSRGLARSTRLVQGFAGGGAKMLGGLTGAFGKLSGLAGIAGVTLSLGGAVAALRSGANSVDDLAKASKKLFGSGATGGLAGLRLAATESGASVEELDKGVGKMLDTISAAGAGEKTSIKALSALGLDFEQLQRLRPEDRLGAIADRLKNVQDAGDKIRIARDIFGRSGEQLIPLLNEGSAAIAKARAEVQLYGQSLTAVDAAKVEESNDALAKLRQSGKGVLMQLSVQFAPVLTEISNKLLGMIADAGGVGQAVHNAFTQAVEFAGNFLDKLQELRLGWLKLKSTVLDVGARMSKTLFNTGRSDGAAEEAELQRRAAMVPEDKREEFIRRAREAGGFQDERMHFGRIGEGMAEEAASTDAEIARIEGERSRGESLGSKFKDFVYSAQNSALERAQNSLLDGEKEVTGELEDQTEERKKQREIARGTAAGVNTGLMGIGGPAAMFEQAAARADAASRAKEKAGKGDLSETNGILKNIDKKLAAGVPTVFA